MTPVVRLVLGLVLFGGLACATPGGPRESLGAKALVPGPDQAISVDQVVLLVDASSSITGTTLFPDAKVLLQDFAAGMPEGSYQVGTLFFGGDERRTTQLAPFDRSQLEDAIAQAQHIGRSTPLPDALDDVTKILAGSKGKVALLIFSDGTPTEGSRRSRPGASLAAARGLVAAQDGTVCIHTVHLARDSASAQSPMGSGLLRDLAALTNCGSFRRTQDLGSVAALRDFESEVFLGQVPLPSVAAAPPGPSDRDGDGVLDAIDSCPTTPRGAPVDTSGCWAIRDLRFAFDRSDVEPRYEAELNATAAILKANPGLRLRVVGHTDARGTDGYNQGLSERRSASVKRYLVSQGVGSEQIVTAGEGASNAAATNDTDEGRAVNRRGSFSVAD